MIPSLQGYKQQRAFIIAQNPMQSTARDFWKMVYDRKCGVIVMLCKLVEASKVGRLKLYIVLVCGDVIVCLSLQEVCYQYWPRSGTQIYREFTVEILGEEKFEGFSLRSFLFNAKVSPSHSVNWRLHVCLPS